MNTALIVVIALTCAIELARITVIWWGDWHLRKHRRARKQLAKSRVARRP